MHDESMFFGGGYMLIFWIFVIVAVIWITKMAMSNSSGNSKPSANDTPLDILKKRYANGEIDDDEFNRRRNELEK